MKRAVERLITWILILTMVVGFLPPMHLHAHAAENPYAGKTISILGASISTFEGTSNGAAADTTNSTIRGNVKYYPNSTIPEVKLSDTWWMQVAEDLGLRLLVNNSWSSSAILLERSGTKGAYVDRCVQLHDNTGDNAGEEPDIICIQMGFNDFSYGKSTLGNANIDYNSLITANGYGTPKTTMEATVIMLDKMTKRYPNAEIYMFNHFKRINQSAADTKLMEQLNADIATVCSRYGVTVVDLYNTLTDHAYIGDGKVHPNKLGMDVITEAVKAAITQSEQLPAKNYRWEFSGSDLVSGDGRNSLTKNAGTTTNGVFSKTRYALANAVVLRHSKPWAVEWKCAGTFLNANGSSGARIFTSDDVNANYNARYIFKSNTNGLVAMGEKTSSGSHNYGIALGDYGIDWTAAHTYRLENRIAADGSNMVYLSVDGNEIGPMNRYYIGTQDQKKTSNWLSGKDFVFPYIGTDNHGLSNCSVDYIEVSENGMQTVALRYDDRYDVTGKTVEIVDAGKPTSYQVGYGVAENSVKDTAVVTLNGNKLIATGIGTAKVKIDGVVHEVKVTAAPLSLLLLIGQSNMEGNEGEAKQSIVCPDGMVYATYGDRYDMTLANATHYAPSALTGSYRTVNAVGGTDGLSDYPVYMLTDEGNGRKGPDSGFAYEWVKQTGEKVWIVNAAHGGTSLDVWQPGTTQYEECEAMFGACAETLRKEIAAGHFTLSHMAYFWCQGCNDYNKTTQWYVEKYLSMHESLKGELAFNHDSDASTPNVTFEYGGIIPVRRGHSWSNGYRQGVYTDATNRSHYESFMDLQMTGPRVAQYWMGNNPDLEDIWLVCDIGEDWAWMPDGTNGVTDYFQKHYPNGTVDYTTQVKQSTSWYTPTTPNAVHDSIHYNQIGYNEVGRESVRNALILMGINPDYEEETTVKFVDWTGYKEVTQIDGSSVAYSGTLVVPMVSPITRSKEVTYKVSNRLKYNYYDLTAENGASGTITAAGAHGSVSVQKTTPGKLYHDHLVQLPQTYCAGTNLWTILDHDSEFYYGGTHWGTHESGNVYSVTIPVTEGMRLYATAWGKAGQNGHASTSGIRVTFFGEYGVIKTLAPGDTYKEFTNNGGYLIAPAGTTAVNIPMWTNSNDNQLYILSAGHDYDSNKICKICGGKKQLITDGHLVELPENFCKGTNLWELLPNERQYYHSGTQWATNEIANVYSVTIPVTAGDIIYATSFGKAGENNYSSNGIRVTFFDDTSVVKTMSPTETYAEFSKNGGYIIAPAGATAVNVPMYGKDDGELYILNAAHTYENGKCTVCGAASDARAAYQGKIISILSASTSTFAGYIPKADGFNLEHRARYPQDNLLTDVNETWWMQVIRELDAKLGINESWAGSQVLNTQDTNSGDLGPDAAMASLTRIQNLGANGSPDLILFFGAGNDMGRGVPLGSFDPASAPTKVDLTTKKWSTLADAYVAAIMRLQHFYPNAQIVAMTTYAMPSYVTSAKLNKYAPVLQAICDHYGVPVVDLRDCGVTFDMLPDNIHPNAEGMDHITDAVLNKLLTLPVKAGAQTVYSVTHKLSSATASKHYYKGVSAGAAFAETVSGNGLTVTVTMGGKDVTASVYKNGTITIPKVTGALVITAKGAFNADGHLQQLPKSICPGTNLWTALKPEKIYYTATGWGNTAAGTTWSITFPVSAGDRIWATSLGAYPANGSTANGVRVTWFMADGSVKSLDRNAVYNEFAKNGYITAPQGAVALNVPMTNNKAEYAVYLLTAQHNYTVTVTAPTCTEKGYTTHTCMLCGDSYVDSEVAAKGHKWSAASCETAKTCSVCKKTEGSALGHKWSAATCETAKTCSVCKKTEGSALGHKWSAATCDKAKTCSVCKKTEGSALGHKWSAATCETAKTCSVCKKTEGSALGHKWSAATCESAKTCSVCKKTEGSALGHKWSAATCETAKTCSVCKKTEGSALGHKWTAATCDKAKTCSVCKKTEGSALGHKWSAATCDKAKTCSVCKKTEGSALGHKWNAATCETAKTCSVCKKTEGSALGHKWSAATCETAKTCSVCKKTEGSALGHKWTAATCETAKTCSVCKKTEGSALGHKWSAATCDKAKTCSVCKKTEGSALGHKWTAATCETAKTCSVCKKNEGSALGHKWTAATCETAKTCSVCKKTEGSALGHKWSAATCETAKTCSVCKKTEGAALGHKWSAATCETAKTCSVCKKTEGSALGHKWSAATCDKAKTCSVCKKTEGAALGHKWTAATCDKAKTCSVCKKTEGSPKDHVWDKGTVTKPATEKIEGVMTYKCTDCGKTRTETIPMLSHTHKYEKQVTAPTCTEQGYTTYTCKCGHSYVDNYTKATGHKAVTDTAISATCTKNGLTSGSHCSVCGVVIKAQEVVPATDHSWDKGTVTKPATEENEGIMTYKCSACGETKTAAIPVLSHTHKYEKKVTAPTCTEQGYTTYTCKCGHTYVDNYTKATGHKAETDKAVAATCTKTGLTAGSHCSVCGVTIKAQEAIPVTGHNWDKGTVSKPATEETEGVMTYKCTACGETKTASIPVLSHTHKYDKVVTVPTCTEQGYTTYTCKCGHSYVDNYTKATGHKAETDKAVAATCTKTGLTAGSHCSVCGVTIKAQEIIPATGHNWDKGTVTKPATEETEGVMTYKCTACGETKTASIPVLSHTHKYDKVVTQPTCTEQGYTTYTCKCGHTYVDNYTKATGHKAETDKAVPATCTKTGLTAGSHCSVCGVTIKAQEVVHATGHNWDKGTVTKPATEEAEGVMTYKCTACGETKTAAIPVLSHTHKYDKVVTQPTCTEQGYTTYTCKCGHSYVDNYTKASGHKAETDKAVAATCTKTGLTAGSHCSVCGVTIKAQEVVPATGHNWDKGTVTKPATEETEGVMTYKCTACGETKTASIPVLSHTHKYEKKVTAPTCTEQGYTTYTCKCGHTYVDNYTKATGHKAETDKAVAATCTKTGMTAGSHCSVCGVTIKAQEVIPATGHNWDKGTVTKPATEEAEGIMTYKCTACGETKTASIPVLSHTHKYEKQVTAPTCTEQGYTTYTCKCGHSYVDNYTNATGHKAVTDAAISATCTKTGLTDGSHCEICGLVLKAQEIIPETGHSWDKGTVTKPATEEAEGVMTFQCTVCGDSRTESIPAMEHVHKYEKETVAASCEKGGYDKFTCACGHSYTENEVEALGHQWMDATCETPKTCERCGKTEGEAAHRFEDGLCVVCGATQIVAEGEYSDKIRWTLDANGVLTVSGTGELKLELKQIPQEDPDAEPVFENVAPWADYADEIKKAVMEEGITEVGDGAFLNCVNLEEVTLPNSLKTVGAYAFADCEKLHLLTFMGDAPVFGENCFRNLVAYLVYPTGNETWTEATLETTGGSITLTDEKPLNPAIRPGDVTADGKADYSDALLILRASIGLEELTEEQQSVADVTGDNKFDYGDALLILRRSIGLE